MLGIQRRFVVLVAAVLLILSAGGAFARRPQVAKKPRNCHATKTCVTTTTQPSTTTAATTTVPPSTSSTSTSSTSTTSTSSTTTTTQPGSCVGVAMTQGQADIDARPDGTTFCLSGTHNWTLEPDAGDRLIGPAVLDGGNSTAHAVVATAPNVTLERLTIRRYSNGEQDGAIHIADNSTAKTQAAGWVLRDLDVGFNSNSGSGTGNGWLFVGGRYHDNRQTGIGGAVGNGVTVDDVEIDHNAFSDATYTARGWSCGDEAGGFKWVTNDVTVRNSSVHHNGCKGLWSDLDAKRAVIVDNVVTDNWDEGIFIEISPSASVLRNRVERNGLRNYNQGGGCTRQFGWAGGITISTSGRIASEIGSVDVGFNVLSGNCQGITGVDSVRDEGPCPCRLWNVTVHDNTIAGPGQTGSWEDGNGSLAANNLVYQRNALSGGHEFCGITC